jgi:CRISPR/Cas system-associated exonuclease Cas4 (RecB family)
MTESDLQKRIANWKCTVDSNDWIAKGLDLLQELDGLKRPEIVHDVSFAMAKRFPYFDKVIDQYLFALFVLKSDRDKIRQVFRSKGINRYHSVLSYAICHLTPSDGDIYTFATIRLAGANLAIRRLQEADNWIAKSNIAIPVISEFKDLIILVSSPGYEFSALRKILNLLSDPNRFNDSYDLKILLLMAEIHCGVFMMVPGVSLRDCRNYALNKVLIYWLNNCGETIDQWDEDKIYRACLNVFPKTLALRGFCYGSEGAHYWRASFQGSRSPIAPIALGLRQGWARCCYEKTVLDKISYYNARKGESVPSRGGLASTLIELCQEIIGSCYIGLKNKNGTNCYLSASAISDYVFCPVSFALRQTYDLPASIVQKYGTDLHEKQFLLSFIRSWRKSFVKLSDSKSTSASELHLNDQTSKSLKYLFREIMAAKIVFAGHDEGASKSQQTYGQSSIKGSPDYVFERANGTRFVIEEKFSHKDDCYRSQPWKNHYVQLGVYLSQLNDSRITDGFLLYWSLPDTGLPIEEVDMEKINHAHFDCKAFHFNLTENLCSEVHRYIEEIQSFIREGRVAFDSTALNYKKCLNCGVSEYCWHKTGQFEFLEIPYNGYPETKSFKFADSRVQNCFHNFEDALRFAKSNPGLRVSRCEQGWNVG